ncbi:YbaN family protein [Clostridium sp.]|uniref:YbaN family protein n=1 Tax=Clostridium sp. TaxID=1506 RepID=UPI002636BD53|nr:YbaN family protein [Clostridium sp.]
MSLLKKYIYITIGLIAFILGAIGVVLPILPTTPFLLLASYCFARGSERFNIWFINTKIYKQHLESFIQDKAMTLKEKVFLLALADIMLAFPFVKLNNLYMRIFIGIIVAFKYYYFIFKIRTTTKKEKGILSLRK